jgi:membrane-bound lytic murein transglycosylase D
MHPVLAGRLALNAVKPNIALISVDLTVMHQYHHENFAPTGAMHAPLIRLIHSALLAIGILFSLQAAHAEEQLALSFSLADQAIPRTIPNARNIVLDIIPDNEPAPGDLWARIRNGFAMHDLNSPLVAKHEQWYASRPDYMARMTDRARRYLHYITAEVERRGMPSEIALLPMIESAFNPGAYSTARASGIWQFIPSTGKSFGMEQNWWYDGRRDIVSATHGALDYLQKLHDMFGDWELALAAYNWGEGAVQRAQSRNRKRGLPVNYASLKMPKETRSYVPKLLAVKNIIANPSNFGLVLQDIPDQPYFAALATPRHMDVKLAAQLANISMEEFEALNPAHNRPVILQDSSELILLPVGAVDTFVANLESYDKPLVSWQAYQPKKGERFDHLAPRFGLSVEKLKAVNGLPGRIKVSTGQTLLVPVNAEEDEANEEFEAFNMHLVPTRDNGRTVKHVVRKGDTLGGLARRYHVSIDKLKQWNGALRILRVGQAITVAQTTSGKSSARQAKSRNRSQEVAQAKTIQPRM